ncbi:MAG: HD domain-containing protein, partial [Oceanisphaera sp.]|nr:HD domain-containing protein [Oceanisphaera sp.]
HQHLVAEMEWDNAQEHCHVGHEMLAGFQPLAELAPIILYHHTKWEELSSLPVDEEDALFANLIFLVDRVDALTASHYGKDLLTAREGVCEHIASLSGSLFAPQLVELFMQVSQSEAFWLSLEPPHLERFLFHMEREHQPVFVGMDELKSLARLFGQVVDAKSRFTLEHSEGVAALARFLAERMGLPAEQCEKIEVAGLLHDLGKLKIPDEVLEKPAPLDGDERAVMHRHSFESYQILRRIDGLEDVARWASYHHEVPNGSGYPFHVGAAELGLEARIIAVADVFQALAQERPYRGPLPPEQIVAIIQEMAEHDRLDRAVVEQVALEPQLCWRKAIMQGGTGE